MMSEADVAEYELIKEQLIAAHRRLEVLEERLELDLASKRLDDAIDDVGYAVWHELCEPEAG